MTDNPIPNDIALLREALKPCPFCGGEARLFPVIIPFDADCDAITIQCTDCNAVGADILVDQDVHGQCDLQDLEAEAITAWNTRSAPGQRDGAAGEGKRELEYFNRTTCACTAAGAYVADCDKHGAKPLTERLENRGAKLLIAYHAAICSPKGVVPDDEFYDQDMAADIHRMMNAGLPLKASTPSAADALGDRL